MVGLGWPLRKATADGELEARLCPPPPDLGVNWRPLPDRTAVHRELRRPNMTLAVVAGIPRRRRPLAERLRHLGMAAMAEAFLELQASQRPPT